MRKKDITQRDRNAVSVIFAFFISIWYVNRLCGTLFNTGGMVFSLAILGILLAIFYKTVVKVELSAFVLAFGLVVVLYYAITRQVAYTTVNMGKFLFYFCSVSVLAMYKCDTEKFLRYSSYISMLIWPFYEEYFVGEASGYINMGLSYALLPLLFAPFFHFLFYRKEKQFKLMYIIYIVSAFLLVKLMMNGTRGAVLSLIVAVGLIYIKGLNEKKVARYHLLRAVVVLILAIVASVYFYEIVDWAHSFLESLGVNARFLDKIIALDEQGDVSNGRWGLFEYTLSEIKNKPILGHGIASMAYYGGKHSYAHNFLLQLMYDGGLVMTVPIIFFLWKAVYYVFCGEERDEVIFSLFMISITIPRALFSGDVWENACFWLLVMHSAKYYNFKRKTGFDEFIQPVVVDESGAETVNEVAEL